MFTFSGKDNTAKARPGPQLAVNEQGAGKKAKQRELDGIAVQTLRRVIDNADNKIELDKLDSFQRKQFNEQIYDTLLALLEEKNQNLSRGDKEKVIHYVSDEIFGYGPITPLLQDSGVTEIMVNGYDNVYVEREGKLSKADIAFRDNAHVLHAINKIITPLGRRIDESSPTVDARLPDGSRVNAIIPPLALRGPSLTIRKFSVDPFAATDLIELGTMSEEMALFLAACVRSRVNIVVSGGTGSGKTTTLNVLSNFIPDHERIVTIEDTAELQLQQDHLVTLESRPANIEGKGQFTIRELVINSLRMRPDRIIVGEVRGGEAFDMLQAMNTGHDGSITTLHANSPRDALARLETMVLMAGMELPLRAIREQIGSAIELIVHQSRLNDGSRRITKISEVIGLEGDNIVLNDIFVFQQSAPDEEGRIAGRHQTAGVAPSCLEKLKARGEEIATTEAIDWEEPGEPLPATEEVEENALEQQHKDTQDLQDPADKKEDKSPLVQLSADSLVIESTTVLPEEATVAADSPGRRIGFFADPEPDSGTNGGFRSTAIGRGEFRMLNVPAEPEAAAGKEIKFQLSDTVEIKQEDDPTSESENEPDTKVFKIVPEASDVEEEDNVLVIPDAESDALVSTSPTPEEKEAVSTVPVTDDENAVSADADDEEETVSTGALEKENIVSAVPVSIAAGKGATQRGLAARIPPGRRGIALHVHESGGLCSYLQGGDCVDVLVIYNDPAVHKQQAARTLAQNVPLLDIREDIKGDAEKDAGSFSIILAVTPAQAEQLAYACFQGFFYLALCSAEESGLPEQ